MRIIPILVHSLEVRHLQCLILLGFPGADAQTALRPRYGKVLSRQYKSLVTFATGAFSGGAFKIYLEQSGWTAADPTNRNLAIGGTMASALRNRRHIIINRGIRMNNMDRDGDGKVSKWEYFPIGLID